MKKRIVSLLLILVLAFTLVPLLSPRITTAA